MVMAQWGIQPSIQHHVIQYKKIQTGFDDARSVTFFAKVRFAKLARAMRKIALAFNDAMPYTSEPV